MKCTFRFSGEEGLNLHKNNHTNAANEIMQNSMRSPHDHYFNDFDIYHQLCSEKGCQRVEIDSIHVRHNRFCHGLQVTYRSIFDDGHIKMFECPPHFYDKGYYSYHGGRTTSSWVHLESGEHLRGLRLQQGDIVDGITFVTNHREIHCGGYGGHKVNMMLSGENTDSHQIIAFAGTSYGVLHRLGFYTVPMGWTTIRTYVMIRWLKDQNRALPLDRKNVVNLMSDVPDDVFRSILKFLL